MAERQLRCVLIVLTVLASAACGAPGSSAIANPAAASYDEYAVASCAAWDALFRAVGNPDTGSGSDLSRALDAAVAAGDAASADRLAADIAKDLNAGRALVAVAGGWRPRALVMVQLDRIFAAYEAMIAAKRAKARHDPNAVDPQAAFEQAGGIEAYFAWIDALRAAGLTGAATERQCPNVPVPP
jgi:hypothetical protein